MDKQSRICPWIMIVTFYALATLSTVQLVGAIYVLSSRTIDILCVWELTLGVLSVGEYQVFPLQ